MNRLARDYVDKVVSYVTADERTLKRLSADLLGHIEDAAQRDDIANVIAKMGDPEEMAGELMDAIYQDKESVVKALIKTKIELQNERGYEYKSKTRIFGLPLVHVKFSNGRMGRVGSLRGRVSVAKGIIAIGDIAMGVLAVGGVAFGGVTFGGVGVGLVGIAGCALGLLIALGGTAVGMFAMGGAAVGLYAFGGLAVAARVAVGGFAYGTVAIGGEAEGLYTLITGGTSLNAANISGEEVRNLILKAYPNTWDMLLNILTVFFR